jgi:hypothetical protein
MIFYFLFSLIIQKIDLSTWATRFPWQLVPLHIKGTFVQNATTKLLVSLESIFVFVIFEIWKA